MSRLFSSESSPKRSNLFSNNESPQSDNKGFLGNYADYAKGAGLGIAQGLGDVGASALNFPGDIISHFSGKESPYHVPHPGLEKYYPEGIWGKLGSTLGNIEGQVIAPGGVAFKALKAVNNPLAKALMGAGAGGLVGAASNEGDRIGSGITGAALGSVGGLAGNILKGLGNIAPLTKSIASSPYVKKAAYMEKHGLGSHLYVTPKYLEDAEKIMRNHPGDIPVEAIEDVIPLAHAGEHDAIHAVQSTLKSLGRDLSKKGGVPGKLGEKYHALAEKIMGDVNEQMKVMGHSKAVKLEEQGKKRYSRYYKQAPLRKLAAKTGAGALGLGSGYEGLKYLLK
jgi:hypothetical protein